MVADPLSGGGSCYAGSMKTAFGPAMGHPPDGEDDEDAGGDPEECLRRRIGLDALAKQTRGVPHGSIFIFGRCELRCSFADGAVITALERRDELVELRMAREVFREGGIPPRLFCYWHSPSLVDPIIGALSW